MADNLSSASVIGANQVVPVAQHNKIVDDLKADLAWAQKELGAAEAQIADMWHHHEVIAVIVAVLLGTVVAVWVF